MADAATFVAAASSSLGEGMRLLGEANQKALSAIANQSITDSVVGAFGDTDFRTAALSLVQSSYNLLEKTANELPIGVYGDVLDDATTEKVAKALGIAKRAGIQIDKVLNEPEYSYADALQSVIEHLTAAAGELAAKVTEVAAKAAAGIGIGLFSGLGWLVVPLLAYAAWRIFR